MKKYFISGQVNQYRIKANFYAISPEQAIKCFQQNYPNAEDIYVIQNFYKAKSYD